MSDGKHHHVAAANLLHDADLQKLFANDIVGERYQHLLRELAQIVEHQWRAETPYGLVKGFFLSGPPGTGKTTLAKRLAFELAQHFREPGGEANVVMALIDGGEIARSRYGESEERILDLFAHAKAGFTATEQRSIILFDDVESVFMARGSSHVKEWHFSQDSVFFHAVDELDTSRSVVILTSNRPDLVDDAIRDRFLTYQVGYPEPDVLLQIALSLASRQPFTPAQRKSIADRIRAAVTGGTIRSIRDAQRFLVQQYVGDVLGAPSLAETTSAPLL